MVEKNITVSIVEDTEDIREAMRVLINGSDGFECSHVFADAEEVLNNMPDEDVDVVIMDIGLPGMDINIKQIDSLVTNPDIYRPDPVKGLRITDSLYSIAIRLKNDTILIKATYFKGMPFYYPGCNKNLSFQISEKYFLTFSLPFLFRRRLLMPVKLRLFRHSGCNLFLFL